MPVTVQGLVETKQALRKFAPDLKRNLDREARSFLKVMVSDARGFVPANSPLSGWQIHSKGKAITAQTSAFSTRSFPLFQTAEIKAGLVSKIGGMKPTRTGFKAEYALQRIEVIPPFGEEFLQTLISVEVMDDEPVKK